MGISASHEHAVQERQHDFMVSDKGVALPAPLERSSKDVLADAVRLEHIEAGSCDSLRFSSEIVIDRHRLEKYLRENNRRAEYDDHAAFKEPPHSSRENAKVLHCEVPCERCREIRMLMNDVRPECHMHRCRHRSTIGGCKDAVTLMRRLGGFDMAPQSFAHAHTLSRGLFASAGEVHRSFLRHPKAALGELSRNVL